MASKKVTAKRKALFLEHLGRSGNVSAACKDVGIGRAAIYEHRTLDEQFAKDWDESLDVYIELLEAEADRRAVQGTDRPVFYKGEECGQIREYSDTLLMFRLKSLAPEKYRERTSVDHSGEIGLTVSIEERLRAAKEKSRNGSSS